MLRRPVRDYHSPMPMPACEKIPKLDWECLRYFSLFARCGSLAAAARCLRVEHATVARRIAVLEAELGLKLVERRARAYLLTADGQRIAQLAWQMDDDAQAVLRAAAIGQHRVAGTVALSVPPATTRTLLAPYLGDLYQRYPAIRLRLIAETRLASLRREVDLAVRLGQPNDPELVARRLRSLTFSYYASADYLARTAAADFAFVGYSESLDDSIQQRQMLAFADGRPLRMRSNSVELQIGAIRAGVGVALLADLPDIVADPALAVLPGGAAVIERELWLVVHRDQWQAPAVRAVAEFVIATLAEPSGAG